MMYFPTELDELFNHIDIQIRIKHAVLDFIESIDKKAGRKLFHEVISEPLFEEIGLGKTQLNKNKR